MKFFVLIFVRVGSTSRFLGKDPNHFGGGHFGFLWKKGAPLGAANAEESWRFW
jgi:hypothetical protein